MTSRLTGGLEPGQRMELRYPLSLFPADAPNDLRVSVHTIDVADAQQRQLDRDMRVMGWADEVSDQTCQ